MTTSSSYLSNDAVAQLAIETAAFKADLTALTEKYNTFSTRGTNVVGPVTIEEGEEATITTNGLVSSLARGTTTITVTKLVAMSLALILV